MVTLWDKCLRIEDWQALHIVRTFNEKTASLSNKHKRKTDIAVNLTEASNREHYDMIRDRPQGKKTNKTKFNTIL